jgi:hypothetical protein
MTRIEQIIFAGTPGEIEYRPGQNLIIVSNNYVPPGAVYAAALELLLGRGPNTPPPAGREIRLISMYISYVLPDGRSVEGEFTSGPHCGREYARLVWEGDAIPPAPDILIGVLKRMRRAAIISRSQLRAWGSGEQGEPAPK